MNQNYCEIKKNKIYAEVYDELLDEELSMYNSEHNTKIKLWIEKKILSSPYIKLSEIFTNKEDIISDIIFKITTDESNDNLQGNTLIMFADDDEMYELFYMEDLTKKHQDIDLNEFGSITNIHLQPVYWGCGIFKTSYSDGNIQGVSINMQDVSNLFVQNYYHMGVMIDVDGSLTQIEFTGEDPFKVIGTNFTQECIYGVNDFNIVPYIEKSNDKSNDKTNDKTKSNEKASCLFGKEIYGRTFVTLLCPTTNRKFWNIKTTTINNLLKVLENSDITNNKELLPDDMYTNPFITLRKQINMLK